MHENKSSPRPRDRVHYYHPPLPPLDETPPMPSHDEAVRMVGDNRLNVESINSEVETATLSRLREIIYILTNFYSAA